MVLLVASKDLGCSLKARSKISLTKTKRKGKLYLIGKFGNQWQLLGEYKGHDVLSIEIPREGSSPLIELLEQHNAIE